MEATQEGVSENAPEADIDTKPVNPREEVMSELYRKADTEHMEEEEPTAEGTEPEAEEMRTIKVDGVEVDVPLSEIQEAGIRLLQKESAADKRLAEASELLKAAKEKTPVSGDPGEKDDLPPDEGEDYGKKFVTAFYDGDEDEAANVINDLASRLNQRTDATDGELVERAIVEIERRNVLREFKDSNKYKAINEDEGMFARWDSETSMLRNEHPDWPLTKIAQVAGDRVNSMLGVTNETALDAKRQATGKAVHSNASTRSQGEPEYKPKTPTEIVAEMRKNRGQA